MKSSISIPPCVITPPCVSVTFQTQYDCSTMREPTLTSNVCMCDKCVRARSKERRGFVERDGGMRGWSKRGWCQRGETAREFRGKEKMLREMFDRGVKREREIGEEERVGKRLCVCCERNLCRAVYPSGHAICEARLSLGQSISKSRKIRDTKALCAVSTARAPRQNNTDQTHASAHASMHVRTCGSAYVRKSWR